WLAGKRDIKEFKEYDTNRDGFITAEEVLSALRISDGKKEEGALTFEKVNTLPGSSDALALAGPSNKRTYYDKASRPDGGRRGPAGGDKGKNTDKGKSTDKDTSGDKSKGGRDKGKSSASDWKSKMRTFRKDG